jgi:hypothetical protein
MSKTTHNEKPGQAIGQGTRNPNPRARALLQDREKNLPVWIRAPMRGQEHFTGLTRPKLYELSGRKEIVSVSIRAPGQVRGCRLFHLPSILAFLERLAQEAGQSVTAGQ